MAAKKKWVRDVKTDSTHPPPDLFTKDAETIARAMARKQVSPKGIGSGIRMIQYFINRAGENLPASRKKELEKAKKILQEKSVSKRSRGKRRRPGATPGSGPPLAARAIAAPRKMDGKGLRPNGAGPMFTKIVLPVDLTDKHQPALDAAARLAEQGGGSVTLLHVVEVIPGLSMEEEGTFYGRLERMARSNLQQLGKALEEYKVTWRVEVRFGKRAAETARYAAEAGADLLIVTGPRIDPANVAAAWQSMSCTIGLLSQCPVLIVK